MDKIKAPPMLTQTSTSEPYDHHLSQFINDVLGDVSDDADETEVRLIYYNTQIACSHC